MAGIKIYQSLDVSLLGDGAAATVTIGLNALLPLLELNSVIQSAAMGSFSGAPTPVPTVTSVAFNALLNTVTVNFSTALTAFDPATGDGFYSLHLLLGFKANP